jgi:hypothetical protein
MGEYNDDEMTGKRCARSVGSNATVLKCSTATVELVCDPYAAIEKERFTNTIPGKATVSRGASVALSHNEPLKWRLKTLKLGGKMPT